MSKDSLIAVGIGFVVLLVLGAIIINMPTGNTTQNTQASQVTSVPSNAKLQVTDEKVGTGPAVKSGDTITVNYKGTLEDGKVFDSSYLRNQPFTTRIGVGQVIKGWDEGLIGMKVGGKRKLVIPPILGYGAQGAGSAIPPNATLTFEIELLKIQ